MSSIPISPLVDYAFKKVLGDPTSTDILIHFINSLLRLSPPITDVEIQNPFNPQDFNTDKLTVVDVKAADEHGRRYQIEVQLQLHAALAERALYSWARTYADQIGKGARYQELRPTLSIWILDGLLFPSSSRVHHRFRLLDPDADLQLTDHIELHMIQLPRFQPTATLDGEAQWIYFLKEAGGWTALPANLDCPALRKAMTKLDDIRQSTVDRERYLAREGFLHLQATLEYSRQQAEEQRQQAEELRQQAEEQRQQAEEHRQQAEEQRQQAEELRRQAEEQRQQAEQDARQAQALLQDERAETERLRARMRAAGLDPDA